MTNKTNASKFDGQMTRVFGKVFDRETFETRDFDIEVPYCRAESVAIKRVMEALKLDDNSMVVIAKDGIVNESAPKWRYDFPSLIAAAENIADEMPEEIPEGYTVVEVPKYTYSAQLWIATNDGDYYTTRHEVETFQKFTKGDARSFVWNDRDELYNTEHVIGYIAPKRKEETSYAIVDNEAAKACRKFIESDK